MFQDVSFSALTALVGVTGRASACKKPLLFVSKCSLLEQAEEGKVVVSCGTTSEMK